MKIRQAPDLDIKRTYNVHVIFDFIDFHINILKIKKRLIRPILGVWIKLRAKTENYYLAKNSYIMKNPCIDL